MTRPHITAIVAVAANGIIGANGTMPWRIASEFAHFKNTTMGGALIMGRVTAEGIGRPLPGRHTIIVTRNPHYTAPFDDATVVHSLEEAYAVAEKLGRRIFVCGGASIYQEAMQHADELIISRLHTAYDGDTYYPEIPARFEKTAEIEHDVFTVETYTLAEVQDTSRDN